MAIQLYNGLFTAFCNHNKIKSYIGIIERLCNGWKSDSAHERVRARIIEEKVTRDASGFMGQLLLYFRVWD